jgi:O-antigen/teichoic acid export membrane protein
MISRLREHLGRPMERSGYALLAGSGFASVLGFLFWALAARLYPADEVGRATALVSSMAFLANLSTLGLRNGILRFLSAADEGGLRLVRRSYAVCTATAVLAGSIFVLGQPIWAADLAYLSEHLWFATGFVMCVVVWVIFIMQDQVLTALHQAVLVPVVQVGYGLLKVGLLVFLVGVPGAVFLSYAGPALGAVVIVSALVLCRLVTRPKTGSPSTVPRIGALVRFAAADHFSTLIGLAALDLLPLLVLARAGTSASAYYYLSFTMAYCLYLVTSNFGSALVVEASRDLGRLGFLARRTLRNAIALVCPAAVVGIVGAPYFLGLIGRDYAEHSLLLQLLLLSAIPQVVVGVGASVARVQRRLLVLSAQQTALSVLVFVFAELGLRSTGLVGVGLAWLASQTIVAVAVLATSLRMVWVGIIPVSLLAWIDGLRRGLHRQRQVAVAQSVMTRLAARAGFDASDWQLMTSDNQTLVIAATLHGESVIVRFPLSEAAKRASARNAQILETIAQNDRLGSWRELVPVVRRYESGEQSVLVETRLPGRSASGLGKHAVRDVATQLAREVARLHQGSVTQDGRDAFMDHLEERLKLFSRLPGSLARAADLETLHAALVRELTVVPLTFSLTQGDCWLGNAMISEDGGGPRLSGIIDWENGFLDGIPDVDLGHLWLVTQGQEIGRSLGHALGGDDRFDSWLQSAGVARMNPLLASWVVLVLAWIEHVSGGVERSPNELTNSWTSRNVDDVLPAIINRADRRESRVEAW